MSHLSVTHDIKDSTTQNAYDYFHRLLNIHLLAHDGYMLTVIVKALPGSVTASASSDVLSSMLYYRHLLV